MRHINVNITVPGVTGAGANQKKLSAITLTHTKAGAVAVQVAWSPVDALAVAAEAKRKKDAEEAARRWLEDRFQRWSGRR